MSKRGWIGVDLDGTLAKYDNWVSPDHIGDPIPLMVARVKEWLGQGIEVRIMTARAWKAPQEVIDCVQDWSERHIGHRLPVTCTKDYGMIELWDDRAVGVVPNSGLRSDGVLCDAQAARIAKLETALNPLIEDVIRYAKACDGVDGYPEQLPSVQAGIKALKGL